MVRVDFRRLDAMLEVLGEGLIQHSGLGDVYRRLLRRVGACEELEDLDQMVLSLQKTLSRLESTLMETRLLPVSTVFGRFPRMVRDVAHAEGKKVRLEVTGGETTLDKAVLDRLSEPLLHLLSNAVAHGLELPEDRVKAGKPAEGLLRLQAAAVSGRVAIRVSDDGRGLDEEAIRAKAEALGVDTRTADAAQLHSLVFVAGLRPPTGVTTLAGRGMGLDVAANVIHALGGTIEVESRPGQGTAFTLSLPVTLAIVRSLIVEVDRERYAVPLTHVAETVRAEPEAIRQINNQGVTQWRGDLIHVADAGAVLGTREPSRSAALLRRDDRGRQAPRAPGGPSHRTSGHRGEGARPRAGPARRGLGHHHPRRRAGGLHSRRGAHSRRSGSCQLTSGRRSSLCSGFADALPAASADASAPAPTLHLLTFALDREEFGIPVTQVREVIRVNGITRVPRCRAHVRGVTNLRGRILAVVEIRTRLGLARR